MVELGIELKIMNPLNNQQESLSQLQLDEISQMKEFANRIAALPILDDRSDDEILGYNAEGRLIRD